MPKRRYTWRPFSFEPGVVDDLELVLETDDPRTAELVEQAAAAHGVELELVEHTLVVDLSVELDRDEYAGVLHDLVEHTTPRAGE